MQYRGYWLAGIYEVPIDGTYKDWLNYSWLSSYIGVMIWLSVVLMGCGRGHEYTAPYGLAIHNGTNQNMVQVEIKLNGRVFTYGRISSGMDAYRPLHLKGRNSIEVSYAYPDGNKDRKTIEIYTKILAPVMVLIGAKHTSYEIGESDPGEKQGPSVFYVANDTSGYARVSVSFRPGVGGLDHSMPPYSLECGAGPRPTDGRLLGPALAIFTLRYSSGETFKTTVKLHLRPNRPLFFIIKLKVSPPPISGLHKRQQKSFPRSRNIPSICVS